MKKIISFSLWGNNPKYIVGVIENLKLAREIYSGWIVRLYLDSISYHIISKDLENFIDILEIVKYDRQGDWNGMFWRFLPAIDNSVDIMISRDVDSRLSLREKLAVDEWLSSDKDFHIMRDHPFHNTYILGGMWGTRNNLFNRLSIFINPDDHDSFWQVDQNFLADKVYPAVKEFSMVHDDYNRYQESNCKSFPCDRIDNHFVGEIYDQFNNRHPDHYTLI